MAMFTKKDLGLLLPDDTPGDPVSLRHTKDTEATERYEPPKPKVDPSKKVVRYRAGQVPHFADGFEDERGFVTASSQVRSSIQKGKQPHKPTLSVSSAPSRKRVEAQVVSSAAPTACGRRERAPSSDSESSGEDVAKALQDSSSESEDEEAVSRRRDMLRNKMKQREAQATAATEERKPARPTVAPQVVKKATLEPTKSVVEDSASASSSGSEWETDTDDSEPGEELMKPVFVPKKARGTVKRQEELAAEEERRQQREQEKAEARKLESRKLVAEEIRREQEGEGDADATDGEMPDDTDGLDPAQEYRDWELREMRRIKRDRDRKEQRRKEAEETLRRRKLTAEERSAEDAKLKKHEPKERQKRKFMQKYYHKGAFYLDDESVRDKDDVRKRDTSGATLEDKFNKEMLPEVMQVKNFGRAGRTKYTHLKDQDTSSRDSLWARRDDIREKYTSRLGGMKDIDASTTKRRRKD